MYTQFWSIALNLVVVIFALVFIYSILFFFPEAQWYKRVIINTIINGHHLTLSELFSNEFCLFSAHALVTCVHAMLPKLRIKQQQN